MIVRNKAIKAVDLAAEMEHWFLSDDPHVASSLLSGEAASNGDGQSFFGPLDNIEPPIQRRDKPKSKRRARPYMPNPRAIHNRRRRTQPGKPREEASRPLDQVANARSSQRHDATWERHFDELKAFQKQHGHCNVSTLSETDAALGRWVHIQRRQRKVGNLSVERIRRLDQIGFTWNIVQDQWERMFAALEEYRRVQGHCRVPARNSKLGWWVAAQRSAYRKGKLDEVQIRRLETLGFQWSIGKGD